jgi:hypothetical protein
MVRAKVASVAEGAAPVEHEGLFDFDHLPTAGDRVYLDLRGDGEPQSG